MEIMSPETASGATRKEQMANRRPWTRKPHPAGLPATLPSGGDSITGETASLPGGSQPGRLAEIAFNSIMEAHTQ